MPEQIELPLPPLDDAILPDDGSVILLATENGSQLFVSGFGLFIGEKSERVVVVSKGKFGLGAGSAYAQTARDHHCFARDKALSLSGSGLRNYSNGQKSGSHF